MSVELTKEEKILFAQELTRLNNITNKLSYSKSVCVFLFFDIKIFILFDFFDVTTFPDLNCI